jgi:nicotinamidase/pyrazinamidase
MKTDMKSVCIVVDFQKDFVDGALGFPGAAALDDKIYAKVNAAKAEGTDVIFTYDTHETDYLSTPEGKELPVPHCLRGSEGWQLYGKTAETVDSTTLGFEKSQFASYELAEYLRRTRYDRVELVGLVSHICVISNAMLCKAALPEAEIIVYKDLCASPDPKLHEEAMDIMRCVHIHVK